MLRNLSLGLLISTIFLSACQSQANINLKTAKNAGLPASALAYLQPTMTRVLGDNYKLDMAKPAPVIPDVIAQSPTSSELKELWCIKLSNDKDFVQTVIWFDGTEWHDLSFWGSTIIEDAWASAGC